MKAQIFKEAVTNNFSTKIFSLLFGVCLWGFFSLERDIDLVLHVPLCFNDCVQHIVSCPESVALTLRAKRKAFYAMDTSCLAVHIQPHDLKNKKNCILINPERLLLPSQVQFVCAEPMHIVVECEDPKV